MRVASKRRGKVFAWLRHIADKMKRARRDIATRNARDSGLVPTQKDESQEPPLDPIDELIRIVGEQGTDHPSRRAKVLTFPIRRRHPKGGP